MGVEGRLAAKEMSGAYPMSLAVMADAPHTSYRHTGHRRFAAI